MQDRPTTDELTDAVAHFLQSEVAPAMADPRLRFRVLIAANLMAVATRELRTGDGPLRAEWLALADLLGASVSMPPRAEPLRAAVEAMNRELCARIRSGEADGGPWAAAVRAHVESSVVRKLEIANPRFLAKVQAERGASCACSSGARG